MKITLRTALITLSLALAGCGAKGPLFMPEKAAPVEVPASEPADAEDAATDPAAGAAQPQPAPARPPATPGSDG